MKNWEIDVAVLCIFFARPEQFRQCFEQVKKARPRVLLLWQDGPRPGRADDIENIRKCREIAEDIDWDCEVHRNYHTENMGCDPSTFYSHKWAFSIVDKCIILEDDLVVSQSFFPFCKELLDRYENDTRVNRICGTNLLGTYDIPYDYFYARTGNSWGWASWRRVAETWDEHYEFLNDPYAMRCMEAAHPDLKAHRRWVGECETHQKEQVPYWEHIIGAASTMNNGLVIYPRVNLVQNVGVDKNSTHAPDDINLLPKSVQEYFKNTAQELQWPLRRPKYMIPDDTFSRLCWKKFDGGCVKKLFNKVESRLRKLLALKIKVG